MVPYPASMTTSSKIDQGFSVAFDFPVVFTRGVFRAENRALVDAIARRGEARRHRVLVFVDSAVLARTPGLAASIRAYTEAHRDAVDLVAEPREVAGGEAAKNDMMGLARIVNAMVDHHLSRQCVVLAVGGGAVLDAVGLAASLVHRGVRLVRVPTTVLAQADSGVGVKNAINFQGTKNLLGTFAPPFAVLNDFDFLRTLPDREWTDGIAEAFKVAILKDASFFEWLRSSATALRARDEAAMERLVRRCAELHIEHIRSSGDAFEFGSARPLDFGHWAAHRIESMSSHRVSHGHAVAIGIALDSAYAVEKGWIAASEWGSICGGLADSGFVLWDKVLARTQGDRLDVLGGIRDFHEHLGGELCITMPRGIGASFEIHEMDEDAVARAVERLRERHAAATAR